MKGHIKKLGENKYLVRISCTRDPLTGKRSQPSKVVCGTRKDADLALAKLTVDHGHRTKATLALTLDDLVDQHLGAARRSGEPRSPASTYRERNRYMNHVKAGFGDRQAGSITGQEITLFYDALLSKGQSARSIQRIHQLLRAAYNWALPRGLVSSNPVAQAICPSLQSDPLNPPTMEIVQEHLAILEGEGHETALVVRIAATIGLRRNEIAGLRWKHVDLVHKTISIVEGISASPGEGLIVTETKTGQHGHGVLSIDDGLVELLEDAYASLEKRAADIGEETSNNAYVFSADPLSQRPLSPDVLTKRLQKHMKKHSEVSSFTLKDLRSFCATQLHATGADVTTAQAVLRHQSSQTTLKYYRAAQMSKVRESTIELGERLSANKPTKPDLE